MTALERFRCQNCGECCGPIPLMEKQLERIIKALSELPAKELKRLKRQKRPGLTCPLRDMEKRKCSVYEARPTICRLFGQIKELECPHNKGVTKHFPSGARELMTEVMGEVEEENLVGFLELTIHWPEIERMVTKK